MSPEQAEGKPLDGRSDVFSFGALLYEMLTGLRAFDSGSTISTLSSVLKEDPRPIHDLAADVPPELERVIARCLRKDRDRRWQSMTDLKVALQELKEETDSGLLVTRTGTTAVVSRRSRGRALPVIGASAGLLVLACAVAWWWSSHSGDERPAPPRVVTRPAATDASVEPPADGAVMTNDDVIAMMRAGVSPKLILNQIRASATAFDLSTSELIRLAEEGVPEELIEAMRAPAAAPRPESRPLALAEGQLVKLVLMQDLLGTALKPGDTVRLAVAENVKAGNAIVIRKGAEASGVVLTVERKKLFRKRARATLRLADVTAADGQTLRLRASRERVADDAVQLAPAAGAADPALIAATGTRIDAFLDQGATIQSAATAGSSAPSR